MLFRAASTQTLFPGSCFSTKKEGAEVFRLDADEVSGNRFGGSRLWVTDVDTDDDNVVRLDSFRAAIDLANVLIGIQELLDSEDVDVKVTLDTDVDALIETLRANDVTDVDGDELDADDMDWLADEIIEMLDERDRVWHRDAGTPYVADILESSIGYDVLKEAGIDWVVYQAPNVDGDVWMLIGDKSVELTEA